MNNKMTMQEWMDEIMSANADISTFGACMPNISRSDITKAKFKDLCYKNMFVRLTNIVLKLFKWTLPDSFDARVIELGYLRYGCVCAFKGLEGKFCLPCIPNNLYNIYANPTQVRVMGFNGYTKPINIKYKTDIPTGDISQGTPEPTENTGVFSRDNDMVYPFINYIKEYSYKLSDKIVALNIAAQRLKSPFQYIVDEAELRDTVKKLAEKVESNEDVIILLKPTKLKPLQESIQLVQNNMKPEILQSLKDAILFDFNQFLENIGINTNPAPDKSQVVLTPEINSNNTLIKLEMKVRLDNRKKFCEDVKSILGIDMNVEENVDEAKEMMEQLKKEVLGNGSKGDGKEAKPTPQGSASK